MKFIVTALLGTLLLLVPLAASADVIPISDVNADKPDGLPNPDGDPVLYTETVTVRGVVTVGTGALAEGKNEIYIQDATGGVFVKQARSASPVVAVGDSVEVTGKVDVIYYRKTYLLVDPILAPGTKIQRLSTGNPVPDPIELTPREIATNGEAYEGSRIVVRDVHLVYPSGWPSWGCNDDPQTVIADEDTSCWIWFDIDTDICGSALPGETFDVSGFGAPDGDLQTRGGRGEDPGILAVSRSDVRSHGSGAGYADIDPTWVTAGETVDVELSLSGEADVLTRLSIEIPGDWGGFSGDPGDVELDGDAFAEAAVVADSTDAYTVTISGAALVHGTTGTVTIDDVTAASSYGDGVFVVSTAVDGDALAEIGAHPEIHVATTGSPGSVVINEIYAHGAQNKDGDEFVELYNPGAEPVDISGWILTDITDAGICGGTNLWEFPAGATIGAEEYVVVSRDAFYFEKEFDFYPEYELFDSNYSSDYNDSHAPNMVLATEQDGNNSTSQEIQLMGGAVGSGALVAGARVYEAVYLYTDRQLGTMIDAVEYRDPVFLAEDHCTGETELGGDDDAYVPAIMPEGYSLGRDAASTDTNLSDVDLHLMSLPTPGAENVVGDSEAPEIEAVTSVSSGFVRVKFSEPLDPDTVEDPTSYSISDGLDVVDAWLSRDEVTVLLQTTAQTIDFPYTLEISGVADKAGNAVPDASRSFDGYYQSATPIADVQAYDDDGISLMYGETVTLVGFVTVPPGIFQASYMSMYIQDLDGWGVNAFAYDPLADPPLEGDLVEITGVVEDYVSSEGNGATTEIKDVIVNVAARGFDVVEPVELPTGEIAQEFLEGSLVKSSGVIISLKGFAFYMNDGSGPIQVYQNFSDLDFSVFSVGDSVEVTGVVMQYDYTRPYFSGYELTPRYSTDMRILTSHYSEDAEVATMAKVLNVDAGESIEISYNGPKAGRVTVRIFDLKGRSIATLYDGMCLGPQRASWDGKDDAGNKVPPGIYLCHVQGKDPARNDMTDAAVPIVIGTRLE